MNWMIVIAAYLFLGVMTTWMASIGHKSLYGRPLGWPMWVAGPIGWPLVLLAGLRRK